MEPLKTVTRTFSFSFGEIPSKSWVEYVYHTRPRFLSHPLSLRSRFPKNSDRSDSRFYKY